jgi:DNA-binding beta-propeller fold protein YncE
LLAGKRIGRGTLGGLCALAGLMLVFCAPAWAERGHVFAKTFAGPGTGAGQLSEPEGVAVNEATGDVYVVDKANNRVEYYTAEGAPLGEFNDAGGLEHPEGIAVDNTCHTNETTTGKTLSAGECKTLDPSSGDVYVTNVGKHVIDKFTPTGTFINEITEIPANATKCQITGVSSGGFTSIQGVAVGTNGELWVAASIAGGGYAAVYNFSDAEANACIGVRETTKAIYGGLGFQYPGFAVDGEDDLYVRHDALEAGSDVISKFNAEGQLLVERVGPSPPGRESETERGLATELVSNDVYIDGYSGVERRSAGDVRVESFHASGLTAGSGVAVDSASGQVYVVDSVAGEVFEFVLEPPGPPTVEGESVSHVSTGSARCPSTSTATCAGSGYEKSVPVPGGGVPGDYDVHPVEAEASGLAGRVAYHYRVVAHNRPGGGAETEVDGAEETFVTETPETGSLLLDGRAWELVSPSLAKGAEIEPIGEQGVVQAAPDGDAVTYLASTPTEADPEGFANQVQVLSTRGPGDWSALDLSAPDAAATGKSVGKGEEYRFFSEDLSSAVIAPFGPFTALSPAASEQTAYLRSDFAAGDVSDFCTKACFAPLVTGCPEAGDACPAQVAARADVPAGTVFGGEIHEKCAELGQVACGPKARAATPDLSAVVLESDALLTEEAKQVAENEKAAAVPRLFEWNAGHLVYVGRPTNEESVDGVSPDGGYVVFGGSSEGKSGLLVRDTVSGETVVLDAAQSGCGSCVSGGGLYQASSADTSNIFFTDENALTSSSGGSTREGEGDLYECEMVGGSGGAKCDLTDLTPNGGGGEGALVQGVVGMSKDGNWVYFVADGVLASGGVQGSCSQNGSMTGECNLYAMHYSGSAWEAPRFVAVVSGADGPDWSVRPAGSLRSHTARVSPGGDWLAFMSQRSLTGYDNEDVVSGVPDEEVYLYHAVTGGLVCVSCDPTGARPEGVEYAHMQGGLAGGDAVWPSDTWIAGNVPGWTPLELGVASYQSRYLSDAGRLFFDSSDGLVARASKSAENVYEFELPGVGDCTSSSASFLESEGGCLGLVSSAAAGEEAGFLDASESGGDVFFLTATKLVGGRLGGSTHVYDAHECTGTSPCLSSQEPVPVMCSSSGECQGSAAPQPGIFGAPASETITGEGSLPFGSAVKVPVKVKVKPFTRAQKLSRALKVCKGKAKKHRRACEVVARREFGPMSHVKPKRKG